MTRDELNTLISRHQGLAGEAVPVNPTIDNPDAADARINPKIPNPNPDYKYVFKDGTTVTLRAAPTTDASSPTGFDQNNLQVIDQGTALKPDPASAAQVSAPPTDKYVVSKDADGNLVAKDNPNYKGDGKDPSSATTVFGDQLIGVADDGKGNLTTKVLLTKDPTQTYQAVTLPDGSLGSFDPKTGETKTIAAAGAKNPGTPILGGDNKFYVWDPKANNGAGGMVDSGIPAKPNAKQVVGTDPSSEFRYVVDDQGNEIEGTRQPNPNFKKPANQLLGTDVNSEFRYQVDKDGNEIPGSREKNPNFQAPKPTALNGDTISPSIGLLQPDGTIKWARNVNQVTVNQAMTDLMNQAGLKVTDKSMSMDDAKNMLTGAVNLMNAQTSQQQAQTAQQRLGVDAANNALTQTNQAAQTGAGLLQNRVTNAMSGFNTAVGAIGSSKMTSAPAGMGENLVNGLSEWVTGLGGGQPVYDSAAAMVNQANPAIKGDPTIAQQSYAALRGAMDLYKQQTGKDWQPPQPSFTSPTTADAGTAGGGATPVQTNVSVQQPNAAASAANVNTPGVYNPQGSTAALNARGLMDNPQGRAMAAGQTPVASVPPVYPGQYNTAYQQGVMQPAGMPATGQVAGAIRPNPMLPIPGYSPYGPFQFTAPVTA
jgi:hypothetical protein